MTFHKQNRWWMGDGRDELRRRFASRMHPEPTRRADFKGYRYRLNLRIREEIAIDLRLIKLVTGEATNGYCTGVLEKAVQESIRELRTGYGDEAWEAFRDRARALRSG